MAIKSYLPEGENFTRDIFLKKGGSISIKRDDDSRSLILTVKTFSFFRIGFSVIGFRVGSSQSYSELPLDLVTPYKFYPSLLFRESNPWIDYDYLPEK